MAKDYYAILGVSKGASDDEIKKAYRKLAHQHHPDKGGDDARFKEVNEAYQVLGDAKKRQTYDRFGSGAFEQGAPGAGPEGGFGGFGGFDFSGFQGQDLGDLGDVLGEMFGFRAGGGQARQPRGKDIEVDVNVTFREAAFGVRRSVKLYKQAICHECKGEGHPSSAKSEKCKDCDGHGQVRQAQRTMFGTIQTVATCPRCAGRGQTWNEDCKVCRGTGVERREQQMELDIPAGIASGEVLKVAGEGEAAAHGARPGDLYVRIHVQEDKQFQRQGNDVFSVHEVPYSLLVLGGETEVDTLQGKTTLHIPEGTQPATQFTLRNQGIPFLRSSGKGNQIVQVMPIVLKKLTREQREALDGLRKTGL
ncbi:molecular chaperone DnaJ [Patescibacteria group bacterium]|nr:molecular chaperone DnaJ [Patescibacteria group bacterium]